MMPLSDSDVRSGSMMTPSVLVLVELELLFQSSLIHEPANINANTQSLCRHGVHADPTRRCVMFAREQSQSKFIQNWDTATFQCAIIPSHDSLKALRRLRDHHVG